MYETVCAFSNRAGGDIFLGIKDNGEIVGVDEEAIDSIKKDFVTTINNSQKINSTFVFKYKNDRNRRQKDFAYSCAYE